jgi:hypothetical protein
VILRGTRSRSSHRPPSGTSCGRLRRGPQQAGVRRAWRTVQPSWAVLPGCRSRPRPDG